MATNAPVVLNEEQTIAVNAIDGVYVVIAGPGAGKSRVVVERHLRMMMSGIPSKDILNLTFTNSAAKNMAERAGILDAKEVFRTFHSFALDMLKKERDKLPFKTCDTIIPVELQDYELLFELVKIYPSTNWRTMREKISAWKCSAVTPDQAIDEVCDQAELYYAWAYRDYEIKCRQQGWLDFSSLMDEAVNMLETNEEVRNRYKRKYIAVDEAQDTDAKEARLVELLFDGNLFIVGDSNQNLFEFRGTRADSLAEFTRKFPQAKILYLGVNHRSTKKLVGFFKEILPVDNGLASRMDTYNPDGIDPTVTQYDDEDQEATTILSEIKDPQNTAILARTNRQLFVFQRLCAVRGVKYNFLGKKDFWEQAEVKRLLGYAKESHSHLPADEALRQLIDKHDMINFYGRVGKSDPMESSPIENLSAIVKMAAGKGTIREFLGYLRRLTHARRSSKALTLGTIHQSKGLEWDVVYLVGARNGVMPHRDGELAEESRIWFVGCSRAAKELHISYYKSPSMYLLPYLTKEDVPYV